MSEMWRALAVRVCAFLGYFKEKIDTLEAEKKELEEKLRVLGSTTVLYIEYCCYELDGDCDMWFIGGDDSDLITDKMHGVQQGIVVMCEECDRTACNECATLNDWFTGPYDDWHLCDQCKVKPDIRLEYGLL